MIVQRKFWAKLTLTAGVLVIALSMSGCGNGGVAKKPRKAPAAKAHTIAAKDKKDAMRDAALNIELLNKLRDETQTLERFLAGTALKEMNAQIAADRAAGKVKIRKLNNVEFELANYTKGIVGLGMSYIDDSYYVEKATGKQLTKPSHANEKRALALRKVKGRWKIFGIFGELKPDAPRK